MNLKGNILSTLMLVLATLLQAHAQDKEQEQPEQEQKKAKIIAERLVQTKINGEPVVRLIDNVVLTHKDLRIDADSAIQSRKTGLVEMFGDITIQEGDSINVVAKRLIYDEKTRMVNLREEVVFKKLNSVTLYTDFLDFDRNNQLAYYYNGGKLVDSTNTLTSAKGYYQTQSNMASFRDSVVAKSPDHTLYSDTLQYNTRTNIVYFEAKTKVVDPEGNIFNYGKGTYDASRQKSDISNGVFETESYDLTGNQVFADDANQYYRATGEVEMLAKNDEILILGDIAEHWKADGYTKIYGHALMKKATEEGDTLYLSADTLISIDPQEDAKKRLLAYHNVKIFKTDLQGKSDSLAYHLADSLIHFFDDPVLWSEGNQITADSINIEIANNTVHQLNASTNSFVVSQDTTLNFNQIKGRDMVARFKEGRINKVDVYGNGESIYFALDEEKNNITVGMNKMLCSNMSVTFLNNQVEDIVFYVNPEGEFIPPHELEEGQKKLKGFRWRGAERPELLDLLFPTANPDANKAEGGKGEEKPVKYIAPDPAPPEPTIQEVAEPEDQK